MLLKTKFTAQFFLCTVLLFSITESVLAQHFHHSGLGKGVVIEDFDSGLVELGSYENEDVQPTAWELTSAQTFNNSAFALKLTGSTWKTQNIVARTFDSATVWQVAAYVQTNAELQGFGLSDGQNVLFYSFAGTEKTTGSEWVSVYQGCFPRNQWNVYQLPVADDWLSRYGYLPIIEQIVYINNLDNSSTGVIYFDQIEDISLDLPLSPKVLINYTIIDQQKSRGNSQIAVQFHSTVIDNDSNSHAYFWDFGDGSTSQESNPQHTFLMDQGRPYTVLLRVSDAENRWGQASCHVGGATGNDPSPVTLNFVGDVMLARNFEYPGGIIPTQGVESIFEPTKPFLGNAADITIANLECPLTTYGVHHPTKQIYFKGSPANVSGLTFAGIDVVTLANNHILDYMEQGMQETQVVLNEAGIVHSGAGMNSYEAYQPTFYSKDGLTFAFLSASDRTGQYNNAQPYLNAGFNKPGFANQERHYIKKQISDVKTVSDLVVVQLHTGTEYSTEPKNQDLESINPDNTFDADYSPFEVAPTAKNRSMRQWAIDQGADLVICHHPHIIHGVEVYKGKLIAHSLGNFVFDLGYPETFPSMILNTNANSAGFYDFSITPVYIDDYVPQRALGELGLYILNDLAHKSKQLGTYVNVDRETIVAQVVLDTLAMILNHTEHTVAVPNIGVENSFLSAPLVVNRTGNLTLVNGMEPAGNYQFRVGRELIWFGNMENEGCSLWELNNANELFCDTAFLSGNRSLQHTRNSASPYDLVTNFEQRKILRSPGSKHTLYGSIKTQNTKNATIEVQYFIDRYASTPISSENLGVTIEGNTPWTFYHKELTIPTAAAFFAVSLITYIPDEGTSYAWFDNVGLICWEAWGKFGIGEEMPFPNDYYFLQVKANHSINTITVNYIETAIGDSLTIIEDNTVVHTPKKNLMVWPNPANSALELHCSFTLQHAQKAKIVVYDLAGKEIVVLEERTLNAGYHQHTWNMNSKTNSNLSLGVYLLHVQGEMESMSAKIIVSQ